MISARRLFGAALSLVLAAPAVAQQPDVVALRFEGNSAFSRTELAAAIMTQPPSCNIPVLCLVGIGQEIGAGLDADQARFDPREERRHLVTPEPLSRGDGAAFVDAVRPQHVLGQPIECSWPRPVTATSLAGTHDQRCPANVACLNSIL